MEKNFHDTSIRVKLKFSSHVQHLASVDNLLSSVKLRQIEDASRQGQGEPYVHFRIVPIEGIPPPNINDLQNYVNSLCDDEVELDEKLKSCSGGCDSGGGHYSSLGGGDDSSYDSDYEGSEEQTHGHDDVSRTVSDTLAQEFSEYVSTAPSSQPDSAYQSKVEFALKLGYTEKLVQAALQKLGPSPEQNELLAELIKLGAHQHTSCRLKSDSDSCDNVDEFCEQSSTPSCDRGKLRPIVVDGSNVAMSHGNKEVFSCRGIKICVDWFRARGHTEITVFVPKWRKETPRPDNPVMDQDILHELERERLLVFTPSREVGGKRMVCYDDRYILKLAADNDGVVVSNDNYRDLIPECPEFRKVVEERILMYSFVNDRFMPPDDPLGRTGPTLDNFLKMPSFRKGETCPYGKKCTYGNKCKYSHPERGLGPQKSVTERLVENAQKQLLARNFDAAGSKKLRGKSLSLPLQSSSTDEGVHSALAGQAAQYRKQPLSRAKSTTLNGNSNSKPTDLVEPVAKSAGCVPCSPNSLSVHAAHGRQPPAAAASANYYHRVVYPLGSVSLGQSEVPSFVSTPPAASSASLEHDHHGGANLHRKLQRQLSINPTCDPRIYQMRRQLTSPDSHHHPAAHHMPASRHFSYQDQNYLSAHSNVTRISSAPPASLHYSVPTEYTHGSCSDPQLNLSSPAAGGGSSTAGGVPPNYPSASPSPSSMWPMHSPLSSASHNYVLMPHNIEESRRMLHYHLASIFPEEQVDAAMRCYPNETNPQKICAAILSMFSAKS